MSPLASAGHRAYPLAVKQRAAIVSLQSHGDRSFLDDRTLALVSGDLRAAGVDNDLIVAVLDAREGDPFSSEAFRKLVAMLEHYDPIVYERVWSATLVQRLRESLPGHTFVSCEGEHALEDPPADYVCRGELRSTVPALLAHLRGEIPLPATTLARDGDGWRKGPWTAGPDRPRAFQPNLRPRVVNPEALPEARTFSIEGNSGCPYQADARANPLYAGVSIPPRYGRGCAFCTTGNQSERRPPAKTAEHVLEQLRYLRAHAPEIDRLVLKDQNPFGYLPELLEACKAEGLSGFSLLLETRADWFLKNQHRFERALETADGAGIGVAPFLVGIESFSRAELDRFNKGTTPETNEHFLAALDRWKGKHHSLDLRHASFGFVLLTPWTTMDDLRVNLAAVERTGLDRYRGHLLVSQARLYADTALYYLAERDGLLEPPSNGGEADASRRYGYFPAKRWRFRHADVARFAELADELTRRTGGRDQLRLWRCLLDAFDAASSPEEVSAESVLGNYSRRPRVERTQERFARLVRPLSFERRFADGWSFGTLTVDTGRVRVRLEHPREAALWMEIVPRGSSSCFARSRHYHIRHDAPTLTSAQRAALQVVCDAIMANGG